MQRTIILASHNPHKSEELESILNSAAGLPITVLTLDKVTPTIGEIEETGTTLEENALIKARAVFAETKRAVVADDTGLEVAALDGAPGVYSARYAGEKVSYSDNVQKLLREMTGKTDRSAKFTTVIAYINNQGEEQLFHGSVEGVITEQPNGEGGFGYDPVFQPLEDAQQRTFAQMASEEKNRISHRGRALQKLVTYLGQEERYEG